jgi:hypothetical protein
MKYINIFHCKTLQNLHKFGFMVWIQTVWQPWYPGANPTIVSYNASAAKIYNAKSSLLRFENKNIFFYYEKTLQGWQIFLDTIYQYTNIPKVRNCSNITQWT